MLLDMALLLWSNSSESMLLAMLMALVHRAVIGNDWHAPKADFSHYLCFYISFFMFS